MKTLHRVLAAVARSPVLLVACDYDGTLAPIVEDPARAHPDREALSALVDLAALPATRAAILSGRSLADLTRLIGTPAGIDLIGSHGAESAARPIPPDPARRALVREAASRLSRLAQDWDGAVVEEKPGGVAFHYRRVEAAVREDAAAQAIEIAGEFPSLRMLHGKRVVELTADDMHKGSALARLRNGGAVVFIGDDVTDEDAFAELDEGDVGIKVGEGDTRARHRIDGQGQVAGILRELHRMRTSFR